MPLAVFITPVAALLAYGIWRLLRRTSDASSNVNEDLFDLPPSEETSGVYADDTPLQIEFVDPVPEITEVEMGFDQALEITLEHEGGYSNRKSDRGGATNRGITHTTYDAYRQKHGLPPRDVREMTDEELRDIYYTGYWLPSGAAALQWPLSLALFDFAVNSSPRRAVKKLQGVLGVPADGDFGPISTSAAQLVDPVTTALELTNAREEFLRDLARDDPKTGAPNLEGWLKRLDRLRATITSAV